MGIARPLFGLSSATPKSHFAAVMTRVAPAIAKQSRRPRPPGAAAIAGSLLAHVLVLSLIGFAAPSLRVLTPPEPPAVEIYLQPDFPSLRAPKPLPASPSTAAAPAEPRARGPVARDRRPPPPRPLPPVPAPAPGRTPAGPAPLPAPGPSGATGSAAGPPAAGVWGGGLAGGGAQDVLRGSVGCDVEDRNLIELSPQERGRCNQRFGAEARKAPPFKAGRSLGYAAAEDQRRYERSGPLGNPVQPCADVGTGRAEGSNFAGGGGCLSGRPPSAPPP